MYNYYSFSEDPIYTPAAKSLPPHATANSTYIILIGLLLAYLSTTSTNLPSEIARNAAIIIGISLCASSYLDSRIGIRNLFRVDLVCLFSIYFLTLVEFLFPQEKLDSILNTSQTTQALNLVFIGMSSLAIGRHLIPLKSIKSNWLIFSRISADVLFKILIGATFLGHLHMLLSVNFNIIDMIDAMMQARFTQPWSRSQIGGGISVFITELSLLRFLIPPLTAVIWNLRSKISRNKLIIAGIIVLFVFFQGFAGGTRNVLAAYFATFFGAYFLTLPQKLNIRNTVLPLLIAFFILAFASHHMLAFRTVGLKNYLEKKLYITEDVTNSTSIYSAESDSESKETFAVDYNLITMGLLTDSFPKKYNYLGLEVLHWMVVKPIPRILLPGKPLGLSISLEEAVGYDSAGTVAVTYIGESYAMAGYIGVIGMSMFFGALSAFWNRLALQRHSTYAMIVFALGFFVAGITMRSLFEFTTLSLPILALVIYHKYFLAENKL